jgi:hypothetical protein
MATARRRFDPRFEVVEELLIRAATRIELPPSLHALAVDRYEAVRNHIERDGSPLKDRVRLFYPQGSMAIRATIRSRKRADGYDIDIVAEVVLPHWTPPGGVLDLLYAAINGEKGSRYYGKVKRQSRCVTVEYEDGMHLDVTPSLLLDPSTPRLSHIFHAKVKDPEQLHRRLIMNSFAFVEHVNARTPVDLDFRQRYAREVKRYAVGFMYDFKAEADVVEVPGHATEDGGKSATIVGLQLLKRNRNERYRPRRGVRMPPSVMLSRFAVDVARPGCMLVEAVDAISAHAHQQMQAADRAGVLVDVRNPTCRDDRFTDRWPENLIAQRQYLNDLQQFSQQLAALCSGQLSLPEMRDLLALMFGEGPAQSAVDDLAATQGQAIQSNSRRVGTGRGGLSIAGVAAPAVLTPGTARAAGHSFYGAPWRKPSKRWRSR